MFATVPKEIFPNPVSKTKFDCENHALKNEQRFRTIFKTILVLNKKRSHALLKTKKKHDSKPFDFKSHKRSVFCLENKAIQKSLISKLASISTLFEIPLGF